MPITGLDGKALTVAIVKAEMESLKIYAAEQREVINLAANKQRELLTLAVKERRIRLQALLRVLESEQGMLSLDCLGASLDATNDGTMGAAASVPDVNAKEWQVEDRTPGAGA